MSDSPDMVPQRAQALGDGLLGVDLPPLLDIAQANPQGSWRVLAPQAALWFTPGDRRLVVAFDNLATLDHPYPRAPWAMRHVTQIGASLLGVQSMAKDWFRTEDAPRLIAQLAAQGFFDAFEAVLFTGASMGGFGALTFAPLVARARVLAFSPQSTMHPRIAPFERRFAWAVKNSDWTRPDHLDAAAALPFLNRVTLAYDPLVVEDKLHALRLDGPKVRHIHLHHATHEAVRVVVKSGALAGMFADMLDHGQVGRDFFTLYRSRRMVRKWARAFAQRVAGRAHAPRQALAALAVLQAQEPYYFVHQAREAIYARHPHLRASSPQE